jgi:aspartokinase
VFLAFTALRRTRASQRSEDEQKRVSAEEERKQLMTFNEIKLAIAARDRQLEAIAEILASLGERLNYLLRSASN